MGTIARNIYLFIPFLLTALSLALLIVVMLSQHNTHTLTDLYFLRINTDNLNVKINVGNVNIDANLGQTDLVPAYYDIGLTNYCTGPANNSAPNFCSKPEAAFYFNPLEVWDLQNSPIKNLIPSDWQSALNTYHQASKFMYAAYVVALVFSILTFILGIASFFLSRITSILTWISADIAALFTAGASAAATAIFSILAGVVKDKLHDEGITTNIGTRLLAVSWIAAAASIAAGLLWSCGCCCGRDAQRNGVKRNRSLNARSAYERVPSPLAHKTERDVGHEESSYGGQQVPMYGGLQHQWPAGGHSGMSREHEYTGYEPYRQA
ncbi:MAG: hypothetical protein Q9162_004172 [Coniocarpon cinnabarinum]